MGTSIAAATIFWSKYVFSHIKRLTIYFGSHHDEEDVSAEVVAHEQQPQIPLLPLLWRQLRLADFDGEEAPFKAFGTMLAMPTVRLLSIVQRDSSLSHLILHAFMQPANNIFLTKQVSQRLSKW